MRSMSSRLVVSFRTTDLSIRSIERPDVSQELGQHVHPRDQIEPLLTQLKLYQLWKMVAPPYLIRSMISEHVDGEIEARSMTHDP